MIILAAVLCWLFVMCTLVYLVLTEALKFVSRQAEFHAKIYISMMEKALSSALNKHA